MYDVVPITDPIAGFSLRCKSTDAIVDILPERGGLVSRFAVGGRELLYLDGSTVVDRTKNVRGGIPILFPIAGKLPNESYRVGERMYSMKQHGFARNRAWHVVPATAGPGASVTLELESDDASREQFPWDFDVRFTFRLENATLSIEQRFANKSRDRMPLHHGFHPYFAVPDAAKRDTSVTTDATRAYDNVRGVTEAFRGIDFTQREVDLHLLDSRTRHVVLRHPTGGVRIEMDDSFRTLVIWTLAGKDFVCVEPWSAPGNALNTGDGLVWLDPGASYAARIAISPA